MKKPIGSKLRPGRASKLMLVLLWLVGLPLPLILLLYFIQGC